MTSAAGVTRRTLEDARRWAADGTALFLNAAAGLTDPDLDLPSVLPGWSRRHVVAHVAANAEALRNLVAWAGTGIRTPMYASPEARAEGIERGLAMAAPELLTWLRAASSDLTEAMDGLERGHWSSEVVTAQGRTVPATEIPWLRAREVYVHAVDLALSTTFADMPEDLLEALAADVLARRGDVPEAGGPLPERVAWLTGRPHHLERAPALGPWL